MKKTYISHLIDMEFGASVSLSMKWDVLENVRKSKGASEGGRAPQTTHQPAIQRELAVSFLGRSRGMCLSI